MPGKQVWLFIAGAGLLALVVAACGVSSSEDDGAVRDSSDPGGGFAEAATDGDAAAPDREPALGAARTTERKIIFETWLELGVEDVTGRYHEVGDIARRAGGYVAESRLAARTADDAQQDARVVIRVPSAAREAVLQELRSMGGVEPVSEETSSTEVTEEYTDLQSRLRNLERSELRYLDLLDRADSVSDILAVGERLDSVRSQIEQLQGRLNVLDDLVDMATIRVTLKPLADVEDEDGAPGFRESWRSAWETVGDVGRVALAASAWVTVAAIVFAPVVLLGGGLRYAAHRRTDAAGQ